MRFFEQIQYKLRNFLYDQERAKYNKKNSYTDKKDRDYSGNQQEDNKPIHKFMDSLDEMDAYLEEKIEEWNLKIKK
ncbi:hypothetical protein [Niameybacter sp.]|uniref:hypothetical protein n=1 Tax=Niameybacter sp. TaxID=2033640 RepID=UPI002FCC7B88